MGTAQETATVTRERTYRCKSRALVNRVIAFLIFVIGLNVRAILFGVLIFHGDDLLFLMLVVVHLGALR